MNKTISIPLLGLAAAAWAPLAMAHEVVVLPGVVGPVGVVNGVTTQGPGTLTVGAQNINTSNEAGGGITTDAANTANIVFTGTSTVTGDVGAIGSTFLNIRAGANATTTTFNGRVFSTTFSVVGAGTVNFNGGFVSNTGSTLDFAGDGFVNVGAGQTLKAAVTNSAGANTGTLTLNGGSILDGAVGAASGLKRINVVGGNALITGQANAYSFSLGTNILNVAGALSIPVGGTINTTIFSPLVFGRIVPVGAATIGNNLHVVVTVTGPIVNGSSFNIVDASSGTTGSTVLVTSNTTRYAFSADPTVAGRVRITTTQIPLAVVVAPVIVPGAPGTIPIVNPTAPLVIAPVIDAMAVTPTTTPLLTAITLLPNAQAVAGALAQLSPGTAGLTAPLYSYRATQQFQSLLASQLEAAETCSADDQPNDVRRARLEDGSACQPGPLRSHWWATVLGEVATQDDSGGFEGVDSKIVGAMVAYDRPLSPSLRLGGGLRYSRATIDSSTKASTAEVTSLQATVYLGYAPGSAYLNGALSYGMDSYEQSRVVSFPGVSGKLDADYDGNQFTAFATTGRHFYVGDGLSIVTPFASVQYTRLKTDAYGESGDPALNLNVDEQTYDLFESTLGLKLARESVLSDGRVLRPEFHVAWLHDFGDSQMSSRSVFATGGPAFTTAGMTQERDGFNMGAGVVFAASGRWSLEGAYDATWRGQGYTAQRLMVTFVMRM